VRGVRQPSLRELQADHCAHQLLLGAVVQIAAKPTALLVARLNYPGARGRELLPRVHVGERCRDQLREVSQSVLGTLGEGVRAPTRCHDAAPRCAGDRDRRADRGPDAHRLQHLHELAADARVLVHPLGSAGPAQLPSDRFPVDRDPLAWREPGRAAGGPGTYDRLGALVLKPQDVGAFHAQDAPDLLADDLEQPCRVRIAGDERCDPTQRRLLGEERFQLRHRGLVVAWVDDGDASAHRVGL
jgi:hypothetical protein